MEILRSNPRVIFRTLLQTYMFVSCTITVVYIMLHNHHDNNTTSSVPTRKGGKLQKIPSDKFDEKQPVPNTRKFINESSLYFTDARINKELDQDHLDALYDDDEDYQYYNARNDYKHLEGDKDLKHVHSESYGNDYGQIDYGPDTKHLDNNTGVEANRRNSSHHGNHVMLDSALIQQIKKQNIYNDTVYDRVEKLDIFYMAAIATSSSSFKLWDIITLIGWQVAASKNYTLFCCIERDGVKHISKLTEKQTWDVPKIKVAQTTNFVCSNPWKGQDNLPKRAGLCRNEDCNDVNLMDIEVSMKPKNNDALGFCGKVLYGEYLAERVIEWFEMNKAMGVDHVILFTYNVTRDTMKILRHYEKTGYLTLRKFDYPMKLRYPRHLGQKYFFAWVDEQVTVFYCMQRYHGYRHVGIMDVDEFIVPSKHDNYKQMLSHMSSEYPNAAGYSFRTYIFVLDWPVQNQAENYTVTRYLKRTRSMWDRRKNIIRPGRVVPGSVWTHGFESLPPYQQIEVPEPLANIFHYRRCRPHWIKQGSCMKGRNRYTDKSMLKFIPRIGRDIDNRRRLIS